MMLFEPPKGRLFYWRAARLASPSLIWVPNCFQKRAKLGVAALGGFGKVRALFWWKGVFEH